MLFDESYWRSIVNFERLAQEGMIAEGDCSLFEFASDPQDAWNRLARYVLKRTEPSASEAV